MEIIIKILKWFRRMTELTLQSNIRKIYIIDIGNKTGTISGIDKTYTATVPFNLSLNHIVHAWWYLDDPDPSVYEAKNGVPLYNIGGASGHNVDMYYDQTNKNIVFRISFGVAPGAPIYPIVFQYIIYEVR